MTDCKFKLKCGAYFDRDENCIKTPERCMMYGFRSRLEELDNKDYYAQVRPLVAQALSELRLECEE